MTRPVAEPAYTLPESLLSSLAERAVPRAYPKNTIVVNEGDRSDAMFVVKSGRVKVYVANENGREVVLSIAGPGEYFGEMALDGGTRSASVIALEPCKLLVVPGAEVRRMLGAHPEFTMALLEKLIRRVRTLTDSVRSLALQDVYSRLARFLDGHAEGEGPRRPLVEPFTHQEIAEHIGASREMVSRLLKDLTAGGYVSAEKRRIVLEKKLPLEW